MEQTKLDLFSSQKKSKKRLSSSSGTADNKFLKSILDGHVQPYTNKTITSIKENEFNMAPSDIFSSSMAKVSQINKRIQDKCNTLKLISSLKDTNKYETQKQKSFGAIQEENQEEDPHKTDKAIGTTEKQIICPCHYNNKQATLRILSQNSHHPPGCSRIQYPITYPPQIVSVRPLSTPKFQQTFPVVRAMSPLSRHAFQSTNTAPAFYEPSSPTKLIFHEPILRKNAPSRVVSIPIANYIHQRPVAYPPQQSQIYVQPHGNLPNSLQRPMQTPFQSQSFPVRHPQNQHNPPLIQQKQLQQQKIQSNLSPQGIITQNQLSKVNNTNNANIYNKNNTKIINRTETNTQNIVNKKSQTNTKNVTNVTNVVNQLYKTYDKMSISQSSSNNFYVNGKNSQSLQNGMTAEQFQRILQQQYLKYNNQNKQNQLINTGSKHQIQQSSIKKIKYASPEQQKLNKLLMKGSSQKLQYHVDDMFDEFNCFEDKLELDKQLEDLEKAKNLDGQRDIIKKMDQLIQKYGKSAPLPGLSSGNQQKEMKQNEQIPQMIQSYVNPISILNNQIHISNPYADRIFPPSFYEIPNATPQPYSMGEQIMKQTKMFVTQFLDMLRK